MSPSLPHEGKIYHGKVIKIESFGVFIEIEGIRSHGLVHISQLASSRVESASDVVSMGDEVYVKVLSVDDNHGKPRISLSMKYCDQSTGEDRDKNGVDAEMDVRRRQPRPSDPEPLQLGAIYNTKCTRCGGHGHVAMECFNTGGSKYDLIPEDDIESTRSAPTGTHRDGNAGRATSRGMGRGRTATLPAWMTTGESNGYESVAGEKDGRHDHREKGRNSRFGDVEREYQPKHSHREDFSGGSLQSMRGGLPGVSSGGKGRGRGATLPAWMTSGESDLSLGGEIENHEKLHKARSSRDRDDSRDGRGHKKSKKRKHDDDSDDDHNRKRKKHHKKHKHKHHKKDEKHKKSKDGREKERSMSPDDENRENLKDPVKEESALTHDGTTGQGNAQVSPVRGQEIEDDPVILRPAGYCRKAENLELARAQKLAKAEGLTLESARCLQ
eukprot:CAMPEP_0185020250 /NCGR_PEP_ID=MMETSP1103-20130426/2852_1 /TAXON_ID=36769 /ORGANISM="Paraphysomonas bandaiensis, Strain Caron Lab Isolate" /LENGTH=440 /DNA_ID=CAMNT_0027551035 /DNA_START=26 /DNA_END=1349 /DNA_ORIENTATION=-